MTPSDLTLGILTLEIKMLMARQLKLLNKHRVKELEESKIYKINLKKQK